MIRQLMIRIIHSGFGFDIVHSWQYSCKVTPIHFVLISRAPFALANVHIHRFGLVVMLDQLTVWVVDFEKSWKTDWFSIVFGSPG